MTNKCCLCKEKIEEEANGWKDGHNAFPLEDGRCCSKCNSMYVIPTRIDIIQINGKKKKIYVAAILKQLEKINSNEVSKKDGLLDFEKLKERIEVKRAIALLKSMKVDRKYLLDNFITAGLVIGHLLEKCKEVEK